MNIISEIFALLGCYRALIGR